jgi:hypothetical protein
MNSQSLPGKLPIHCPNDFLTKNQPSHQDPRESIFDTDGFQFRKRSNLDTMKAYNCEPLFTSASETRMARSTF